MSVTVGGPGRVARPEQNRGKCLWLLVSPSCGETEHKQNKEAQQVTSQVELRAMDGGAKPGRGTACVEPSSHRGSGACVLKMMASLSKKSDAVWLLPCSSLNAVVFFRQIYRPLNILCLSFELCKVPFAIELPQLGGGGGGPRLPRPLLGAPAVTHCPC